MLNEAYPDMSPCSVSYACELRRGNTAPIAAPSNCELNLSSHVLQQAWQTDEEAERLPLGRSSRFSFMPFVGPLPEGARGPVGLRRT